MQKLFSATERMYLSTVEKSLHQHQKLIEKNQAKLLKFKKQEQIQKTRLKKLKAKSKADSKSKLMKAQSVHKQIQSELTQLLKQQRELNVEALNIILMRENQM
ncbi:MAG: hypothetical protein AAGG80_03835, partial [Pseudomonadota bacterium]